MVVADTEEGEMVATVGVETILDGEEVLLQVLVE